jgi:sugar lactone lactonase YvrE
MRASAWPRCPYQQATEGERAMNTSPERVAEDGVEKTRDNLLGASDSLARFKRAIALGAVGIFAACGGSEPAAQAPASPPPAQVAASPVTAASAPAPSSAPVATAETATAPAPAKPTPALTIKDLAAPESALYYAKEDVYLVSNVNGSPSAADDNGFISRHSPDGTKVEKWIEGGKKGVKLDAPKGLAIAGDTLYVADITRVRTFDLKTGKPKTDITLPGATFANDVAVSADGKTVYVSDSGIKIDDKGVTPTGTDAVFAIEKNAAKVFAKGEDLGRPNGLAVDGGKLWVVTFGSGELYSLDKNGKKADAQKLPKGALDGIVALDGDLLISSWEAQAIYSGKPGGTFALAIPGLPAPADIGYDAKRGRVLVPRMQDGLVEAYELK